MASIVERKNKAGEVTSYQVKWRLGGSRTGDWQTERFDDEDSAKVFRNAVEEHGHAWPPGWVKGEGYIDAAAADELQYRFDRFARASIENRTASQRYKNQRLRAIEMYLNPTFGNCDVRSPEHFSKATIGAWVNKMMTTQVKRGAKRKIMSPETLRGLHGLLSSVLKEATVAEPPLRDRNPCDLTRLPSLDDWGIADDESTELLEFMSPEEVAGLCECFPRASDRLLVRTAYGSGLRWGEITALARRHARNPETDVYQLRVTRAWKRIPGQPWELGAPKSRAGRRTVDITHGLWCELADYGLLDLRLDDLIFHDGSGGRLPYSTFYDRWTSAVAEAHRRGVLPEWKTPTFHDVRHSHVAALLSDGHSLTYVQRRLGHESITTTSDRYGHLLETAHKAALVTLSRVMNVTAPDSDQGASAVPTGRGGKVYVVDLSRVYAEAFWSEADAHAVAEQWALDRGQAARVEECSAAWWSQAAGGLGSVRSSVPARARVWTVGPAYYSTDGTEHVETPSDHTPREVWAWEWEGLFTDATGQGRAQWCAGGVTEVVAWGVDRDQVLAAYEEARAEALRICGSNPHSGVDDGEQQETPA
ncbi:site-specific integrase [Streptomyces sp. DH12]|uniref:tyrosine-type recombinase/integrase n=1 Tax=Streptomyces sp. DH12 TaxID=2857010 RepID=UPI001E5A0DCD|nr:site-specific integrase [Streptomyces sp. DH12]